ncbi:hypothetical protein ACFO3J_23330 [Streptomyces polygonati]|uniref:Uncharacterized protein n=1 Tax=Streptomyces polygonati TaxID=1617087 RepID=A0ABV8HR09_9ACTN
MTDSDAYFAEPARIAAGVRQIDQISTLAQEMVRDFAAEVNLTRDWPGTDDSFAQQTIPQEKKERQLSGETGQALSDAVSEVAAGTVKNLDNILGTQNNVLDAIHSQSSNGSSGRH